MSETEQVADTRIADAAEKFGDKVVKKGFSSTAQVTSALIELIEETGSAGIGPLREAVTQYLWYTYTPEKLSEVNGEVIRYFPRPDA